MIKEKVFSGNVSKIKIQEKIGERLDLLCYERSRSKESWEVVCREAVDAFKNKLDDDSGMFGLWQGEFWGKWILSAIDVCEYTGDENLKDFIRSSIDEILSYQEPSGYIGTYRNPNFLVHGDLQLMHKFLGWPNEFNWNVWGRKYTLWGLIEGYRLLGDAKILEAAVRFADQTVSTFDHVKIKVWYTGVFSGLPSCSIMKPMLMLYNITGKQSYLDFCKEIADFWECEDTSEMPRLITNALSGRPIYEWYDLEKDQNWTKSYEMMSCFEGLLELYRVTGVEKYLEAVKAFWEIVEKYEITVIYGMGNNDNFTGGKKYINAITEPCDSIHYMRICHDLFRFTGDVKYIDGFELNFLNAYLAGVYEDGKWGARGVRTSRFHNTAPGEPKGVPGQCKMKYNHCCVNNMPRAVITAAKTAVMTGNDNIYVNFYTPFTAEVESCGAKVKVAVSGSYLVDGKVDLKISAPADWKGNIMLRLPRWAAGTAAVIAGKKVDITEAGFYKLELASGVEDYSIAFELRPVLKNTGEFEVAPDSDYWRTGRWLVRELVREEMILTPFNYLYYGPLVLARSIRLGTDPKEIFADKSLELTGGCALTPIVVKGTLAAFDAELETSQGKIKTRFCDYASAGNWISSEHDIFNIYF